jgi:hypothetical protein
MEDERWKKLIEGGSQMTDENSWGQCEPGFPSVISLLGQSRQKGLVVGDIVMSGENHTTILRILRQSKKLRTEAGESGWYSNREVA